MSGDAIVVVYHRGLLLVATLVKNTNSAGSHFKM